MLPFFKLHGLGNDYVFIDALRTQGVEGRYDLPELARRVSDRHTGVGSDGVILICKPTVPKHLGPVHARMRIFNADGSEAQNCGNGLRCVAKLLHDEFGMRPGTLVIEAGGGLVEADVRRATGGGGRGGGGERVTIVSVTMGKPQLGLIGLPGVVDERGLASAGTERDGDPHERTLRVGERDLRVTLVGMGNPHAVVFVEGRERHVRRCEVAQEMASTLGPLIERHRAFPRRINAHFVAVEAGPRATMHTWERGSGLTRACGTGACAVLVAGVLTGRLDRRATLTLPGGRLAISWSVRTGLVTMTGPAVLSFAGVLGERLVPLARRARRAGRQGRSGLAGKGAATA